MRLTRFRITNYRSILDSGWVDVESVTSFVGQSEAGKSNLFEALFRLNPFIPGESYNIDRDWPVDNLSNKDQCAPVCRVEFILGAEEIEHFILESKNMKVLNIPLFDGEIEVYKVFPELLSNIQPQLQSEESLLIAEVSYEGKTSFEVVGKESGIKIVGIDCWAKENLPKFVLIQDYGFSLSEIDLDHLAEKLKNPDSSKLTNDEKTIKIILELAKIDIGEFSKKGATSAGRGNRFIDKKVASSNLSKEFGNIWTQKEVEFDIDVDGSTLNIFVEDKKSNVSVRLDQRSSGFRWYVSFAWKFTHASQGEYKDCILLLEEPGIQLHPSGQKDLLKLFHKLSESNIILYTTHLASMIDLGFPERVRIVETVNHHTNVTHGIVSDQREPAAVIEMALGLTGDMSGLLGNRLNLIVEGAHDSSILYKLSELLRCRSLPSLSDRIYLWTAHGASKIPMYAALAVGHKWNACVLLDSDSEGEIAKGKIEKLKLEETAKEQNSIFHVISLGEAAKIEKNNVAIEDLFGDEFYIDCVNSEYNISLVKEDLPNDGSSMITKRVGRVLKDRWDIDFKKDKILTEIMTKLNNYDDKSDIPGDISARAGELFKTINQCFSDPNVNLN